MSLGLWSGLGVRARVGASLLVLVDAAAEGARGTLANDALVCYIESATISFDGTSHVKRLSTLA